MLGAKENRDNEDCEGFYVNRALMELFDSRIHSLLLRLKWGAAVDCQTIAQQSS